MITFDGKGNRSCYHNNHAIKTRISLPFKPLVHQAYISMESSPRVIKGWCNFADPAVLRSNTLPSATTPLSGKCQDLACVVAWPNRASSFGNAIPACNDVWLEFDNRLAVTNPGLVSRCVALAGSIYIRNTWPCILEAIINVTHTPLTGRRSQSGLPYIAYVQPRF